MKRSHVILGGGVILIALLLIMYFTPLREGNNTKVQNKGVKNVTSANALTSDKPAVVKQLTPCQICINKNPNNQQACKTKCK